MGLGVKLLFDRVHAKTRALDPENPMILMTGPLTGTMVPSSSNWTIVTINRNFEKAAGTSHSHGFWGVRLKSCGYDGIVIEGSEKKPVYLYIQDGCAELKDATKLWGLDSAV